MRKLKELRVDNTHSLDDHLGELYRQEAGFNHPALLITCVLEAVLKFIENAQDSCIYTPFLSLWFTLCSR